MTPPTVNRRILANRASVTSALALVLSAQAGAANAGAADYVGMGSSYAAGPGILQSADTPPNRCGRSTANFAHLLAAKERFELLDVACNGATTQHLLGPWNELAAQIDAVQPTTRLVTLTIGGNDLRYIYRIVAAAMCGRSPTTSGAAQRDCAVPGPPSSDDEAALRQNLTEIVQRIRTRSPTARIIFVEYLNLFAASGNCPSTGLTDAEVAVSRAVAVRLAEITDAAAKRAGAEVLPLNRLSADHSICAPEPWVNGAVVDASRRDGIVFHPNLKGMSAIAAMLETVIEKPVRAPKR